MLYFAICDENPMDVDYFTALANEYFAKRHQKIQLTTYASGEMLACDIAEGKHFDCVFLGIFTGATTGIEAAKKIRQYFEYIPIIFITSSQSHALQAFSVHALDYILKPINKESFALMCGRLMSILNSNRSKSLLVKFGSGGKRIAYSEILYIESQNTLVTVYLISGESHRVYAKLSDLEEELQDKSFIRCHQSYIVNLEHVQQVGKQFTLITGMEIPIRRQEVKEIRELYYSYVLNS